MGSPIALFVLFGVVFAAIFALALWFAAKRRKDLAAWAQSRGLVFSSAKDSGAEDRYPAFDCLRHGRSRYAYNQISGDWNGRQFHGFDYRYVTGSGKNRQTHTFSAVVLTCAVPLKPLFIRPEGFFDKVTEFFGYDDIDFESAQFSREFYVKSPDKRWAYDVVHQRTMEFLLNMPRFTIKFDRHRVIVYRSRTFKPSEFGTAAELVEGILDRLPEYVVQQQSGQG